MDGYLVVARGSISLKRVHYEHFVCSVGGRAVDVADRSSVCVDHKGEEMVSEAVRSEQRPSCRQDEKGRSRRRRSRMVMAAV